MDIKNDVSKKSTFIEGFYDLMNDEGIQLPLREDDDYKKTLEKLFDYYCDKLLTFASEKQVNLIRIICESILKMIDEDSDEAMRTFERLMTLDGFKNNLHIIENNLPIDGYGRKNINLFRLRKVSENKNYKRKDIFHDPRTSQNYKERKPYRYNLESRPSLYLGSTVYCCYKELGAESDQNIIGSLLRMDFEKIKGLYIIDLANRPIDFVKRKNKYKKANLGYKENEYIFIYPFIAACSVVVPSKENRNIIEYKITNILYRWLVKNHNDKLCGIRYFSCHDAFYCIKDKHDERLFEKDSQTSFTKYFINYVFPVSNETDGEGYCSRLKDVFNITKPKYLKEFKTIKDFESNIKYSTSLQKLEEKNERTKG
ncbi:MAG: hypothetical protein ACLUVC_13950 [Longibaculum sp.]